MNLIFDLDLTLINSSLAEPNRQKRLWQTVYSQIPTFTEYEGIKNVLAHLRKNKIPYAIVTSSPAPYCKNVCAHWGFCQDYVVAYHDTKRRKPSPDPILLALEKMKAKPNQTLSFGDRDIDIIASNAAGVRSVACLWGSEEPESLKKANPNFIIHHPDEIIPLIQDVFG
jgi:phosphoglycolate phosphatase-like HAD superfamily hydrolase